MRMSSACLILSYLSLGTAFVSKVALRAPVTKFAEKKDDTDLFRALQGGDEEDVAAKLGIDIGGMLEPLNEKEAAELQAAAAEIVNDAVANGIDEIETLRAKMKRELDQLAKSSTARNEFKAKQEEKKLLNKIDMLTDAFLSSNEIDRASTRRAAAADRASAGKGVEIGVWGVIDGAAVTTSGKEVLLGSVQDSLVRGAQTSAADAPTTQHENKLVFVADTASDPSAKQLVGPLTKELQDMLPGLEIDVYKPTAAIPLGADNAQAVVLFLSSLSDRNSVKNILDRVLRKTIGRDGKIGAPPTQIIAISSLGTTRFDKMPYSMKNFIGGKLEKQRQMEEAVVTAVRNRAVEPALDYTICHLGELKATTEGFDLKPLDVLDGNLDPGSAVTVVSQAIALQPYARNATFSATGKVEESLDETMVQDLMDGKFLACDGPEVFATEIATNNAMEDFDLLWVYVREWADFKASSAKGLTTPVKSAPVARSPLPPILTEQEAVQLLFLSTKTGSNYLSKEEERSMERAGQTEKAAPLKKNSKEGGLKVMVEVSKAGALRVRAARCNYGDNAVLKEISEATLIKSLEGALSVWSKERQM